MANKSGIHIKPSKKGTFTAAAKKHGKSVQGFASQVLAHKENYSPAMVKKANFARNAAKWNKAQDTKSVPANKLGCPGGDCRKGSPLGNLMVNVLDLNTLPQAGDLGANEAVKWSRKDYKDAWKTMVNPFIYTDYGAGMKSTPSQADYDKYRSEFMQTHSDLFVPTVKNMGEEGKFKLTPENQYDIAMKAFYAARNPGVNYVGSPYLKASGRDPQNLGFEDVVRDFSSAGWENAANWMYSSPYSAASFPKKQAVAKKEAGGKMPKAYAAARFRAAGNEDMLEDYGYAMYGADIEPFVYHGYNDTRGNWKDPGLKKKWAAKSGAYVEMGGTHSLRPLPGKGNQLNEDVTSLPGHMAGTPGDTTPLKGHYYPTYGEDMRPLAGHQYPIGEDEKPLPEKEAGGGIPQRYKNMGFTRVGQKKSGDGKHKWKVLAKKGDQYKVVQGGWRGMQDFKQHGSEKRRDKFWSRMGGKNSAKAKDPFSPLYWHKRFGTWEAGGMINEMEHGGDMPDNPGFRALPEYVQQKIMANMEAGGKMPAAYARARFAAAGNEHLLGEYGYSNKWDKAQASLLLPLVQQLGPMLSGAGAAGAGAGAAAGAAGAAGGAGAMGGMGQALGGITGGSGGANSMLWQTTSQILGDSTPTYTVPEGQKAYKVDPMQQAKPFQGDMIKPPTNSNQFGNKLGKGVMQGLGTGLAIADMVATRLRPKPSYNISKETAYYNPYAAGTGSEAISQAGSWIGNTNAVGYPYASGINFMGGGTVAENFGEDKEMDYKAKGGKMIKRADGSYSRRGLWDNIRANRGSGRKPTPEMLRQERKIKAKEAEAGMGLTGQYYPRGGEIMNVGSDRYPIARMGGNIRRNYVSEYEQGGELEFYDDRGGAQPIGDNPKSAGPIVKFTPNDAKHRDTEPSGIKIAYHNTPVEVEGGETGMKDKKGNFQVWGNMYNPLTGNKFKKDGELLAKATEKAKKKIDKGVRLVNDNDPSNPYELLAFNSGRAKMMGGDAELTNLDAAQEYMNTIQQGKLAYAEAMGIEPMRLDARNKKTKIAKMGGTIKKGQASATIGEADIKMNPALAFEQMRDYGSSTPVVPSAVAPVAAAPQIDPGTYNTSYMSEDMLKTMTPDEFTAYANQSSMGTAPTPASSVAASSNVATGAQSASTAGASNQGEASQDSPLYHLENKIKRTPETTKRAPYFRNMLPELYAMLTNEEGPTMLQQYRPEMYQDYSVSFRDRLAENDRAYRSALQATRNPAEKSELFARKMEADNKVLAEEFRTNQAIRAGIINQNIQARNDAALRNMQFRKQAFDEKLRSREATKKRTFDALQSMNVKQLMSEKNINELNVLENMYDFRYDPNYRAIYQGMDPNFIYAPGFKYDPNTKTFKRLDPNIGKELPATASEQAKTAPGEGVKSQKAGGSIMREFKRYKP